MIIEIEQGTEEWLNLRMKKITATDSAVILNLSPFKTNDYLLWQKIGILPQDHTNDAMKRGSELEPIARNIYEEMNQCLMNPTVHLGDSESKYEWAMCSTDGLSEDGKKVIEIKSGKKSWTMAENGLIPGYYMAQIQHILWLTGAESCDYVAYDGKDSIKVISVPRDQDTISHIIKEEYKFYLSMSKHFTP